MIELTQAEWRAVDTPVFQRLRSVRQLALTYLVYPGALHTRFEHSIGARDIAKRLGKALKLKDDELTVIQAAALLHDIGHGVFSHVSEQVIDERSGAEGVHEAVSVALMRKDPDLHAALGEDLCRQAADVVALKGPRSAMSDVVSGPTDADKLDYLLRDSYFAGVNYGRYDLDRIIDSARVIAPRSAQTELGFDADGLWAVEELLMARHHMHRQVYGHKTRLATDIMVTRALRLAIEEGVLPDRAYRVDTGDRGEAVITDEFLEAYLAQTDVLVLDRLGQEPEDSPVGDLGRRLAERRLLRQSVSIRLDQRKHELGDATYAFLLDPDEFTRERIGTIEEKIAGELGLPVHLVALYLDSRKNPTYRNPGAPTRKDIMVQPEGPRAQPRLLHSESEIFREETGLEHTWLYLYTPELSDDKKQQAEELLWNELRDL
jgi:uncharacterized protein